MSVVSSFCCYCGAGCGELVECDAWKLSGVHVDQVYPAHHASARGHVGRVVA